LIGIAGPTSADEAMRALADELRRRVDLVAMIGNVAKVKRAAATAPACCPFHNEKSPSFQIYGGADAHYHCFGCGAHGDAITFRMQFYNLDFKPALGELAEDMGCAIASRRSPARRRRSGRRRRR
jgi:DNA primase